MAGFILGSKKGNAVADSITFLVVAFIFALVGLFAFWLNNDLNDLIQADPDFNAQAKQVMDDQNTKLPQVLDGAFILFVILFWGMLIVASFQTDTSPLFFVFSTIMLFFVFLGGAELSNAYADVAGADEFGTATALMPMTQWVMNNLLVVIIIISASALIALYAKTRT